MNWKEFFKPTWSKLILTIILFVLLPVPFQIIILGGPSECGGLRTCELGYKTSFAPFGGLFLATSIFVGGNQPFENPIDYLWKIPYLIIGAYLISSLLMFTYNKFRKTKKKRVR